MAGTSGKVAAHAVAIALLVAGCSDIDTYGNHVPPFDVPTHFTYDPVVKFEAANVTILQDWCRGQHGELSGDGLGCIVATDYAIDKGWPCYEALTRGLPDDHATSTRHELDAICNGWTP